MRVICALLSVAVLFYREWFGPDSEEIARQTWEACIRRNKP